jgi:hypothetical protein
LHNSSSKFLIIIFQCCKKASLSGFEWGAKIKHRCWWYIKLSASYHVLPFHQLTACSFGWWLMLVCSEIKVLLVADLFLEKITAGWWLVSQTNRAYTESGLADD